MARIGTGKILTYTVQPVLDTSIYASGDVLAVPIEINDFFDGFSQSVILQSLQVFDAGDQGADLDVLFMNANGSIGALNAAFNPADTVGATVMGIVNVVAADYTDMVNSQLAVPQFNPIVLHAPNNAGSSLWVAMVSRGTPTYGANDDITLHLGVLS